MKHIKRFDESLLSDFKNKFKSVFVKDRSMYINGIQGYRYTGEYTTVDGYINVDGDVDLSQLHITELPIRFKNVTDEFNCYANELTSLKGCPETVGGDFICSENYITSLEYSPRKVGGDLWCYNNRIRDFYGIGDIDGEIKVGKNPVYEIYELCPTKEFIKYLNEFRPIRGKTILGKRLQECLYMCDIDLDITNYKFHNYTLLE